MEDVLAFEDDFVPEPNPSIRRAYRPPTRTFSVYSESDGPNELGDTGVSSLPDHPCDFDWSPTHQVSNSSFVQEDISYQKKKEILWKWQMNYHEASIFLDEGANNVKFTSHPRNQAALPAYLVVHNRWFYTLELTSALLLLSLAIVEKPAYASFQVPLGVHASVEAVGLVIVGFETFMKIRWQGVRTFVCHKRSMIKACILIIMTVESVVILIRQSSHFRVMRALRPIFLIDNHYSRGVRRFIRQILQSLPPILDMLGLLFFFMVIFSILGFFLFSDNPRDPYFRTLFSSFVSLFVLLTTANFPDVMMPSYSQSRWASTFFITYLAIELYILMNLMLAVVYASFWQIEKDKFRNLLLHKRKACQRAFRLLVSKKNPDHITFKHFEGLLKYFKPNMSMLERYLVFKAQTHQQCSLGVSTCLTPIPSREPGLLTLDKFYSIYNLSAFEWKPKQEPLPWYSNLRKPLPFIFQLNTKFVQWKGFRGAVYGIIFANGAVMIMRAIEISNDPQIQGKDLKGTWDIYVFVGLYALEAVLKLLGLGVTGYFRSGWNTYDFAVTVSAILGACAEAFLDAPFVFVLILRPMRLLRLFKLKRRYRDVFSALVIVLPRMASAAIVLLIVYYFFAVAGMELFSEIDLRNCCKNTSVQDYFVYNANTTGIPFSGDYFLNNFEDLFRSGVTLFELTVVNNWFVIMIGFTVATGSEWTRLYFMSFYVVTLIVLTIIVSVILEAFLFRIQYEKKVRAAEVSRHNPQPILKDEDFLSVEVSVWPEELQQVCLPDNASGDPLVFVGRRKRTKAVLQTSMYREEIKDWLLDAEEQEAEQTRI